MATNEVLQMLLEHDNQIRRLLKDAEEGFAMSRKVLEGERRGWEDERLAWEEHRRVLEEEISKLEEGESRWEADSKKVTKT